ncbi:DNA ligase LigA-related protein [Bradyrhizobium sp. SZCCHNRI2049]|uniref:DNA ligase LigA-related protein n=1 Tax=Bradyrhizobium sp. SZCCHNRI2049 TaxID=3057287 RepID=UPI0029165BD2|nr:hypothetical protein [Bradyrhizobium sp. SZCCHNRI2049]
MNADLAARKLIVAAYIYYCLDHNIMSDHEYDALSNFVADHWDELDPVRQWQLGSPEQIRASGFHILYTVLAVDAARQAFHEHTGRYPHQRIPGRWKRNKELGLRYVTSSN